MENKETLDKHIPISYANSYFKVVPINDKVATVRPASAGEVLRWRSNIREESREKSAMIVIPHTVMNGLSPQFVFNNWSDLYAYAVRQANVDLVYDEFVEAVREALPECSAVIDEALSEETKEVLEEKDACSEILASSNIGLSEEEITLGVSKDVDELIIQLMEITTNETISEVLSLINSTCNQEHDVLSIDWEIVELDSVFRLDLVFEVVKRGFKKPSMLKTVNFFPLVCSLYD